MGNTVLHLRNLKKQVSGTNLELRIYLNTSNNFVSDVKVKVNIFYDRSGGLNEGLRVERKSDFTCVRNNFATVSHSAAKAANYFKVKDEIYLEEEVARVGYVGPLIFNYRTVNNVTNYVMSFTFLKTEFSTS